MFSSPAIRISTTHENVNSVMRKPANSLLKPKKPLGERSANEAPLSAKKFGNKLNPGTPIKAVQVKASPSNFDPEWNDLPLDTFSHGEEDLNRDEYFPKMETVIQILKSYTNTLDALTPVKMDSFDFEFKIEPIIFDSSFDEPNLPGELDYSDCEFNLSYE